MILPKINVPNIIRIFKKWDCPTLKMKLSSQDETKDIPEQHVIEAENITLRIYGIEYFTQYPDTSKTVNHDYKYQVPIKLLDWKYVAESIKASRHSLRECFHGVKVMADLQHGHFNLQANTLMNMNRKVPFEPEACVTDTSQEKGYKPWFCCNAAFLIEMIKKNKTKKTVIINFEDQTRLEETPDDKPKIIEPVLLRFPDETNKNGITEKSLVFFSASTKWDDKYLSQEQEAILSRSEILDL